MPQKNNEKESPRWVEINISHLKENVSSLESERRVLIDNYAGIAVNVVVGDWNGLLVRDEAN